LTASPKEVDRFATTIIFSRRYHCVVDDVVAASIANSSGRGEAMTSALVPDLICIRNSMLRQGHDSRPTAESVKVGWNTS